MVTELETEIIVMKVKHTLEHIGDFEDCGECQSEIFMMGNSDSLGDK